MTHVALLRRCPGPNRRQEAVDCAACLTLLTALSGSSTPPTDLVGAAIFSTRTRSIRGNSFFRPDMAACSASFSSLGSPLVAEKLTNALLGVVMQRIAPARLGFTRKKALEGGQHFALLAIHAGQVQRCGLALRLIAVQPTS